MSLTDERIAQLWDSVNTSAYWQYRDPVEAFARAVEAEAREDADECIAAQEDMLRELRAERDELRGLLYRVCNTENIELWAAAVREARAALATDK